MQKIRILSIAFIVAFAFVQCTDDNSENKPTEGFPQKFTVDVPTSISNNATLKSANSDEFSGAEIYEHLRNFIALGEEAADLIEGIMIGIATYGLDEPMDFTFEGEDGRLKHVVVTDDATLEGIVYNHQLNISDLDSESNEDFGLALQVFWNDYPVVGVAMLKPYNWDLTINENVPNTMFRVDYSEAGNQGYEASMEVSISGWEYDGGFDRFAMDNLKMFVGKNGDVVDVYGNSNHPAAWLFNNDTVGISWSFVASGDQANEIAAAEVGLPWSTVDSESREVILGEYSIYNVLIKEVQEYLSVNNGIDINLIPESLIAPYLTEATAPAFFDLSGFISGGELPGNEYKTLVDNLNSLTPFNPSFVANLEIDFKN